MADESVNRLPLLATAALGMVVIVGFGVWFYGYGVLLEPIGRDTGWSEGSLSTTYGLSMLGSGVLATVAGRLLGKIGSRVVYGAGALVVLAGYLALSSAGSVWVFVVVGVLVGSVTGALGYYAAVHTILARLVSPASRAKAITTNTLWGAMASPIFLPLIAWLIVRFEWRSTLRLTGVAVSVAFAVVAVSVPDTRSSGGRSPSLKAAFIDARRDRVTMTLLGSTFAGGVAMSIVILFQVPVMVGAGLTLALASSLAGARGLLQLGGRVPIPWLVRRFGSREALRGAHALTAVSCLILPFTGLLPAALAFAVLAGVAIGALVPVESIFMAEIIPSDSLGVILGLASLARGLGFALGPVIGGTLSTGMGSRTPVLIGAAVVAVIAARLVPALRPADA